MPRSLPPFEPHSPSGRSRRLQPLAAEVARLSVVTELHPLPDDALARLEASSASVDVRRIAQRTRARYGAGHTLQTTALFHEAYLRLGQSRSFVDETHFLSAAALAIRHALINYAQSRVADKRGGGGQHVTLSNIGDLSIETDEGILALDEAMQRLSNEMPRLADVVECRFFGGYGEQDTARALGVSLRTVQRDWLKARAWLYRELGGTVV